MKHTPLVWFCCFALIISAAPRTTLASEPLASEKGGKKISAVEAARNALWQQAEVIANTVVVKYKSAAKGNAALQARLKSFGLVAEIQMFNLPVGERLQRQGEGLSRIKLLRFKSAMDARRIAAELCNDAAIEYAEPRFRRKLAFAPNDPFFADGSSYWLTKIEAAAAWDITTGSGVLVGIVDSGVQTDHPDLDANIERNAAEIPNNGLDDDANGYIDDYIGWDFGGANHFPGDANTGDNDPNEPVPYHGTHCAGVAAGVTNNSIGIASIGYNSRILAVKAGVDAAQPEDIFWGYEGVLYAAERGAKVINCSWGGFGYSQAEQDLVTYVTEVKGSLVVAAAGNDGADNDLRPFYPSAYRHVLSVGATGQTDVKASFSNYGVQNVDLVAPGDDIRSTWKPSTYNFLDGTSFSAPMTAGAAALIMNQFPTYTPEQVGEQLRITADNVDALNGSFTGKLGRGRLNVRRALQETASTAVRLLSAELRDASGDGYLDAGESVTVKLTFKNFLAATASSVNVNVSAISGSVTLGTAAFALAPMSALETDSGEVQFTVQGGATVNEFADFSVGISSGGYIDNARFSALLRANYLTLQSTGSTLDLSFNNRGNLGYDGTEETGPGVGLLYNGNQLLFEGSLIVGTSASSVEDVARANGFVQSQDFAAITPPQVFGASLLASAEGRARFDDSPVSGARLGLNIIQSVYLFAAPPDTGYAVVAYRIINTSGSTLSNFHLGFLMDWDVINFAANESGFDAVSNTGYTKNPAANVYAGASHLDNAGTGFSMLLNDNITALSKSDKWNFITAAPPSGTLSGDAVNFVGAGPFTISTGDTLTTAFGLVAGTGLEAFRTNISLAKTKWTFIKPQLLASPEETQPQPQVFRLEQNYPNPFNPNTVINYQLSANSEVNLKVYDVLGREVATLVNTRQAAGKYAARFNASRFASGIYFYRLQAGSFVETKKMLLVR
ncbi:MAG: S8 family serine peptidase [Rhizobacter sp.]|nr:S8 family serine peptidase [Chlorobiales bacterium]